MGMIWEVYGRGKDTKLNAWMEDVDFPLDLLEDSE